MRSSLRQMLRSVQDRIKAVTTNVAALGRAGNEGGTSRW
jgi:hypothetical protein